MRLLLRLESERKFCAIWYILFCQSPNHRIAIVVLGTTSWPRIQRVLPDVLNAVDNAHSESYVEISVPYIR
ncbi:MAG: hypothetical protein BECKG1743D_GA0114223_101114 [Candidatus Kentron sp. G]|nr:MAG: hypothetical protein BECKG1743F_GA0114225_101334 [Candidatus Kentron sp. G]VFM97229.1 MAG: hypothetical protein BECKG1743E_GA0114224_101203 [Candidatus Kentron sp. G]VFM99260.1 MAG: hypothetical protein BECKG1743D_GA0114223_101114 [Candidatus Kentron sp. G]